MLVTLKNRENKTSIIISALRKIRPEQSTRTRNNREEKSRTERMANGMKQNRRIQECSVLLVKSRRSTACFTERSTAVTVCNPTQPAFACFTARVVVF